MSPVRVHLVWAAVPALYDLNCAASLQVSLHGRLVSKRHFGHKLSGALIVKINSDQSRCCALSLPVLHISSLFLLPFSFLPSPLLALSPLPPPCFSSQITIFPSISYHCHPFLPPSPSVVSLAGSKQPENAFSSKQLLILEKKNWWGQRRSKDKTTLLRFWCNLTWAVSACNVRCNLHGLLWCVKEGSVTSSDAYEGGYRRQKTVFPNIYRIVSLLSWQLLNCFLAQ